MIRLNVGGGAQRIRRVLCLGAHSDDIEIGCGGTLLKLLAANHELDVRWIVFSGDERRAEEARCAARLFLGTEATTSVSVLGFRDGFFPYMGAEIKSFFEELKSEPAPDLIFTHHREDLHQDHRLLSELTWNTFRDHMVLEYEIPKFDGGLGNPNVFVPIDEATRAAKTEYLMRAFGSQRSKRWFTEETFSALMRLRGIESASPTGWAEGFYARKLTLDA